MFITPARSDPRQAASETIRVTRRKFRDAFGDFIYEGLAGKTMQSANSHMHLSRELLQVYWTIIDPSDQEPIRNLFIDARKWKSKAEDPKLSSWKRITSTKQYQLISKKTFMIIKDASERAIDDGLESRMANDMGLAYFTTNRPIFDIQQRASSIVSDWSDCTLEEVGVDKYKSAVTGENALVINTSERGVPTQHILTNSYTLFHDLLNTDVIAAASETGSIVSSVCQTDIYGPISEEVGP